MESLITFTVEFYSPEGALLLSDTIKALGYWEACETAWCEIPDKADDFQLFVAEAPCPADGPRAA